MTTHTTPTTDTTTTPAEELARVFAQYTWNNWDALTHGEPKTQAEARAKAFAIALFVEMTKDMDASARRRWIDEQTLPLIVVMEPRLRPLPGGQATARPGRRLLGDREGDRSAPVLRLV